jgi:GT2 family glycosyltransferase
VVTLLQAPSVSIVVLNFNGSAYLDNCLHSLLETDYPNMRIVVVDNNSSDGSWRVAGHHGDRIAVIRNRRNLGWSGGNNVGIRHSLASGARYIVLANNDIKVHPAWIREAVAAAELAPNMGVIGFDVFEAEDAAAAKAAFEAACRTWRPAPAVPAAHVGGMAMFVRATLFEELGLIDESFWAYGDETDFLRRTMLAGYTVATVHVPVWHFGSGSFGRGSLRAALLQTENNIQLLLKYAGLGELLHAGIRHVWRRCLPRRRPPAASAVEQRLGGRSFLVNAALLPIAGVRIAVKLPRIMHNRRATRRTTTAVRLRRSGTP